jgi:hypothetical protein
VLDMPIHLADPDAPLGTHFFVAMHFAEGDAHTKWLSMNFEQDGPTAAEALSRIRIPDELRERISMMLTPGSSLIISDDGISGETAPAPKGGTDFIVLMK